LADGKTEHRGEGDAFFGLHGRLRIPTHFHDGVNRGNDRPRNVGPDELAHLVGVLKALFALVALDLQGDAGHIVAIFVDAITTDQIVFDLDTFTSKIIEDPPGRYDLPRSFFEAIDALHMERKILEDDFEGIGGQLDIVPEFLVGS